MTPLLLLLIAATSPELPWVETATTVAGDPAKPPAGRYAPAPDPTPTAPRQVETRAAAPPVGTPPTSPDATEPSFAQRLTALNLALSATIIGEPDQWQFDRLEEEARALNAVATSETERAQLRALRGRLDRFASLASRFEQANQQRADQLRDDQLRADGWQRSGDAPLAANRPRIAPPVQLTKTTSSRHDAQGTLRPVISKRPGAPKYAVVDEDGQIAALVTPTPETEKQLSSMLGQRVGLTGRRGYLTDLRREHVVAERVTPLETLRR